MLGVIIHWDHKPTLLDEGKRNLFQHYDYVCRAFAVDKLVIVDVAGTMTLNPPHTIVSDLDEALALFPDTPVCLLHPDGKRVLGANEPASDVVFVTGADFDHLELPLDVDSLRIRVPNPEVELWANQALVLALADRYMRG
jgi:hypothetical protein